jgi:hypothetical protein
MSSCEQGYKPTDSIKGEKFLDHPNYCQLLDELSYVE